VSWQQASAYKSRAFDPPLSHSCSLTLFHSTSTPIPKFEFLIDNSKDELRSSGRRGAQSRHHLYVPGRVSLLLARLTRSKAHVRVIHGAKHPRDSKFDVVSSDVPGDLDPFNAYVVVYPPTLLVRNVENASPAWSPVMTSASGTSVIQVYEKLLADLRKEMREVMGE